MRGNPIFGELARDWDRTAHAAREAEQAVTGWFEPGRHRQAAVQLAQSQAPDVHPATVDTAPTQEEDMSVFDTIKQDIAEAEAKFEGVAEADVAKLKAVMANPETAGVFSDLAGLAAPLGIPAGAISGVATGIKTLLGLYVPQQPAATVTPEQPAPAPTA